MNLTREKLLKLVADNPDLEILPLVADDASIGDYSWSLGSWGRASVEEYVIGCDHTTIGLDDERIYLRDDDKDEMYDKIYDYGDNRGIAEDEVDTIISNLPWKKAIFVHIEAQ